MPRAGATLVRLNTRLTEPELRAQLEIAQPRMLIVDGAHGELAAGVAGETEVVGLEGLVDSAAASRLPSGIEADQLYT